jgi:hypothetical protein
VENFVCNLYSITTNQAAIIALFRVMNRYVGNLPPMPRDKAQAGSGLDCALCSSFTASSPPPHDSFLPSRQP